MHEGLYLKIQLPLARLLINNVGDGKTVLCKHVVAQDQLFHWTGGKMLKLCFINYLH